MSNILKHINAGILILLAISMMLSCVHDPFPPEEFEPMPQDTMMVDTMDHDTMMIDTMEVGMPCDSNIIYYQKDVQPILNASCATSGCHDASSAASGVVLDNYENAILTANVVAFDLNNSMLYNVITDDDEETVMPPSGKLENEEINLIALWILQGAEQLECDSECNTTDVKYSQFVSSLMQAHCNECHASTDPSGGVVTDAYDGVAVIANDGRLFGAINWSQGYSEMPLGQEQMEECDINKIKSWIDDGAMDN